MNPENPARPDLRAALAVLALVTLVGAGCSKKVINQLIPNQSPEVTLTSAPLKLDNLKPDFYAYTLQWSGYDPDGRVDHFLYAVDPPNVNAVDPADTAWHATARNEQTFFFSAGHPLLPVNPTALKAEAPHIFAIYAVDDKGTISKRPAVRAFFSYTQPPFVFITDPRPNIAFTPSVTPTVTMRWDGQDPDGQFTTKPVRWAFRLFSTGQNADFPSLTDEFINFALLYPDTIRALYAPGAPTDYAGFRGWTTVSAETTSFQYRNLTPESIYLFVLTGFDEAGAYDPVFQLGRNMLKFQVTVAGSLGPIITMFNEFFTYTYLDGRYDPSPSRWFRLEVPADQTVTFNWIGTPPEGADMRGYRWVMDLVDLTDNTPRSKPDDWNHWSTPSLNTTQATIGPFLINDETHLFYIEAEDNNGLKSLGIIYFKVVRPTFEKSLLFVDDTRLKVDTRSQNRPEVDSPSGPWPTAAELDTFLFAKGGSVWKDYPAGSVSPPGIFNGYDYDTLGTRGISLDGTVPLSVLGRYRHVVWYVDETGATMTGQPTDRTTPITALRLVNSPGRPVILSTYITQGGLVWLAGGGAAFATLRPWNKTGSSPSNYSARDLELVPGRFMYDFAHWQQGVEMLSSLQARKFGSFEWPTGASPEEDTHPSPSRGYPPNSTVPEPEYASLPPTLSGRTLATDPPPPLRQPDSFYLIGRYPSEYIYLPTFIREDYNEDPDIVTEYSTLDTIYMTFGPPARPNSPCMTYYHGLESQPLVFSGFNFWVWQRPMCIQLADWVLQSVWGLTRNGSVSRSPSVPARTTTAAFRSQAPRRADALLRPQAARPPDDIMKKIQAARRRGH
jgi:hypothetical protein